MAEIRLAANLVNIPVFDYGHLQIVYVDGSSESEIEVQSSFAGPFGKWVYPSINPPRDHPSNTPGYGDPDDYAYTTLSFGDRDVDDVWAVLQNIHTEFANKGQNIDYDLFQNSNSYINTVLDMIGFNLNNGLLAATTPTSVTDGFPGATTNVNNNSEAFAFNLTLTDGKDFLRTGKEDDTVNGGGGDDTLQGGTGDEDTIDLSALGFTGIVFGSTSAGELRVHYSSSSDRTYVRDDNGSDFEFYLNGDYMSTLSSSDFVLA